MLKAGLRKVLPLWAGGTPRALQIREELRYSSGPLSLRSKVVKSDHVQLQFTFDSQKVIGCGLGEKVRLSVPSTTGQEAFLPV